MTLGEFGLTVGRSDLSANGQLTGYIGYLLRDDVLSGRLYVKSELLDLNEIMDAMPSAEGGAADEEAPAEPGAGHRGPAQLEPLAQHRSAKGAFRKDDDRRHLG